MSDTFASTASIACRDPRALSKALADYWAGFDIEMERKGARTIVARLGLGEGEMEAGEAALLFRLACPDLGKLELLRSSVTESLAHLLRDEALRIDWRGDMPTGRLFSDFREVRVVSNVAICPRIRRLTFTGDDIARFGSSADIHVRLYFPPEGLSTPEWPFPGLDGRTVWPAEDRRPEVRYYTVRRFSPERNEIEIDFVMHEVVGPGCAFAARAKPGALCGIAGPVGRAAPQAGWMLLAGDETALPAIARILEEMPREARGEAHIEVDGPADEIPLDPPAGVALRWLHRNGAPAGATGMLAEAVAAAPIAAEDDAFVWVACEFHAAKAIRKHLKVTRGLARDRYLVVGYWHRDHEDEHEHEDAQAA